MKIIEANRSADSAPLSTIMVCVNVRFGVGSAGCGGAGSVNIADDLEAGLKDRNMEMIVDRIHCLGLCNQGPNVRFYPGGDWFKEVALEDVPAILDRLDAVSGN